MRERSGRGRWFRFWGRPHTHSSTLVRHATAASPFPSRFPIRTRTRRAARSSPTRFRAGSFRPGKSPSSALSSSILLGDLRAATPVEDVAAPEELLGSARSQTLRQYRAVASPVGTPLIGGRVGAEKLVRCVRLTCAAGAVTVRRQAEDRDPTGACAHRRGRSRSGNGGRQCQGRAGGQKLPSVQIGNGSRCPLVCRHRGRLQPISAPVPAPLSRRF